MSQQALRVFLEKLHDELQQKSAEYRTEVADLRQHSFRLNAVDLGNEVVRSLKQHKVKGKDSNLSISDLIEMDVKRGAITFTREVAKELRTLSKAPDIKFNSKASHIDSADILFVFQTTTARDPELKPWQKDPAVTFNRLQLAYEEPMKGFFAVMKEALAREGQRLKGGSKDVLNLSHELMKGVLETQLADAFNSALQEYAQTKGAVPAAIDRDLERLGIDISIRRNDATDTMEVFLGGTAVNQSDGLKSKADANRKKMMDQIEAILKTNFGAGSTGPLNLAELEGSDSPVAKKRKQALKAAIKPFEKAANVTIKLEDDIDIEASSGKAPTVGKNKKAVRGKSGIKKPKRLRPSLSGVSRATQNPMAFDPMLMLTELNRRLPSAIIANMGDPALNNQTGRFAASVRVVDILQTPKGFPSIGYTYLSQYRTFEKGNKQGSTSRDPRTLIDRTIRELAVQFVIGRLFTRRV